MDWQGLTRVHGRDSRHRAADHVLMFKRPPPRPATQSTYTPRPRAAAVAISDGKARMVVPVPKRTYYRSKAYRQAVACLSCAHCGVEGYSQAAHSDASSDGKGKSIKACDSTCYPACADRPGVVGCHTLLGAAGMDRDERRALEARYAAETRATLGRA